MRTRPQHWIEMDNRSSCNPDTTSSSSTSDPQTFSYNTNVESFRPIPHRGKIVMVEIGLNVFSICGIQYCISPRFPPFLSFVVAQVYSSPQNYLPTAPMTDFSTVNPSSSSNIFNYDTPPPSYDQVCNQTSRGRKSLHHEPTDSKSKFD